MLLTVVGVAVLRPVQIPHGAGGRSPGEATIALALPTA